MKKYLLLLFLCLASCMPVLAQVPLCATIIAPVNDATGWTTAANDFNIVSTFMLGGCASPSLFSSQQSVANFIDFAETGTPLNPAPGYQRVYANSSHLFSCILSTGASCGGSGGGGGGGVTDPGANGVMKRTALNVTAPATAPDITVLWSGGCSSTTYLRGDGTCATPPTSTGGLGDPGANGMLKRVAANTTAIATNADVLPLWTGTCNSATYLRGDGSCNTPPTGASIYYTLMPNLNQISMLGNPGWSWCYLGNCGGGGGSPGGNGTPISVTVTYNVTSPSMSGSAMTVGMNAPTSTGGTNELYTFKLAGNPNADTITNMVMDLWVWCDSVCGTSVKQWEFDNAIFCSSAVCRFLNTPTNGTNYMFGSQCNLSSGRFQVWNQAPDASPWKDATYSGGFVPCTAADFAKPNTWHHIVEMVHKVAGDGTSCTNVGAAGGLYPFDHYDLIILDGARYVINNTNTCAGALNSGYASVWLPQVQMNVGTAGTSGGVAKLTYDNFNFSYF